VLTVARRLNAARPFAAVALLATFMVVDLAWNNAPHVSTALAPQLYEALEQGTANETVQLLKARLRSTAAPDRRDRVELIGIDYHWPNLPLAQDFDHVFGHNPLRLRTFQEATHAGDTVALASQRMFSPLYPSYRSAFADLVGVRLIATGEPIEQIDPSLQPEDLIYVGRTADAFVYENPRALPRVMLVKRWLAADFKEIVRSGWPDVDPRQTVLLEQPPLTPPHTGEGNDDSGSVRLLRYANTEVTVEVDSSTGGILVLNDVWHPWWRATVDSTATGILKANVMFRAVVVSPGRHIVRFAFHPLTGALSELRAKLRSMP
jgi:hypothetical protein